MKLDQIILQNCCESCAEAKEKCIAEQAENRLNPINQNLLASCTKVRDDCLTLMSHYFNMQHSMDKDVGL